MGRRPCCEKEGLNRGAWTAMEDKILADYIKLNGEGRWRDLTKHAGLKRCGKSCRLRWLNYLRPDIKRGDITADEEELVIRLHRLLGNRWSLIAGRLLGRTDNEIKNYWNTNLSKRVQDHQLHRQSNAKQSDNLRVTKSSTATQHVQPQSPSPNVVIRPKAIKLCTSWVFINRPPPPPPPPPPLTPPPAPPTCNTQTVGPAPRTDVDEASTNSLVLSEGLLEAFLAMDFGVMGELGFSECVPVLDICEGEQSSPSLAMEDWQSLDASAVEHYLLGE